MRTCLLVAILALSSFGQTTPDPAYPALSQAYHALKSKDYDHAIAGFLKAIAVSPLRPDIRKDLAYTYLKVGEAEAARDQFGEAMRLDPQDSHVALEFAFLAYESRTDAVTWKATARRIFDKIRQSGDKTAEQAFQNIDRPLAEGMERWKRALELGTENFSAHFDLAQLAEQRDQLDVAAEHYLRAWRLLPARKGVLVDLGRVLLRADREKEANAALLAASRGGETRASELARELLPRRYPFVYEFRGALSLDPSNVELHRELAYLLLKMSEGLPAGERETGQLEAEDEFRIIVASNADDLLSVAQLGFLYLGRDDVSHAMPLLKRVLAGADRDLANKVRLALHLDIELEKKADPTVPAHDTAVADARLMAEKSYAAGYMKDALKYLTLAHESDPKDYSVILKLGFAENMLHQDAAALHWFSLARSSPDAAIAGAARKAFSNLRPDLARLRTTVWLFPFYSTRWHDTFAYSQIKTEFRFKRLPIRPYASIRFVGDTRQNISGVVPESLSESSFIVGAGVRTNLWHGGMLWGEAGTAVSYLGAPMTKDLRGGVAWSRFIGQNILAETPGPFFETNVDGVFVSRFGNDSLAVMQNKLGLTLPALGPLRSQVFVNADVTQDTLREYWANFVEAGPGVRLHLDGTPKPLVFSVSLLRGSYTRNEGNPRRPNFLDLRVGFWYAFTH